MSTRGPGDGADGGRADDPGGDTLAYWSDPKRVREFAERDADHRLVEIARDVGDPASTRVLDLGCAAGRNAVYLAERGFDVVAVDLSPAMVAETVRRLTPIFGESAARARVHQRGIEDLSFVPAESVDLVVALGILHFARDEDALAALLTDITRLLSGTGRVLVSVFAPGTRLGERGFDPVPGARLRHVSPDGTTGCLLDPPALDAEMARVGLVPVTPTERVYRETDTSVRVVTNGFFRRPDPGDRGDRATVG